MSKLKLPYYKLYKASFLRVLIGILNFVFVVIIAEFSSNILELAIKQEMNNLSKQAISFVVFIICSQLLILYLENVQNRIEILQEQEFRMIIYQNFINQKISVINKIGLGGIKERVTRDIENTTSLVVKTIPSIIIGIITGTAYIFYIALISPKISFILFVISFVQLIPPYIVKRCLEQNYMETAKVGEEWMEYIIEGCNGLSTIKMNSLKKWYVQKLNNINKKNVQAYRKTFKTVSEEDALNNMTSSILTYGTYIIIGFFVFKKYITLEAAVKIVVLCGSFYKAINVMFSSISQIFIEKKAHSRLLDFINDKFYNEKSLENSEKIFEFKNVSFAYDDNVIFKNLNLEILRGKPIVIVGENGVGKSTFIKLLLGIKEGYDGKIKYRGMDIKEISEKQLYKYISYVPQEDVEFNISPEELLEMISNSQSINNKKKQELILTLGLSNEILRSKSFSNLSGGERKKIYLIAGLMREAEVYILDEPTNSLDVNSQNQLIKILLDLNKPLIIISHDENLINKFSCQLSITKGEVRLQKVGDELYV